MNVEILFGLLVALLGAVFGSFLNVLVIRMHAASSLWGRSRCVHCQTPLRLHHLVPILSWLWLRGRCAFCQKPIHFQYPLVEAAAATLGLMAYLRHPNLFSPHALSQFAYEFFLSLDLLVLIAFDLRWKLLPVEFMGASALLFGLWNLLLGTSIVSLLIGVAVCAGFLGLQVMLSRGKWMGSGDPWAGALVGAALGWPLSGIALYLTYLLGGFVAVFLLLGGLVKRGARIAFVPLLSGGALLAIWFGPSILAWISDRFAPIG